MSLMKQAFWEEIEKLLDEIEGDGLTGSERAKYWGAIGGRISKRGKSTKGERNVQD